MKIFNFWEVSGQMFVLGVIIIASLILAIPTVSGDESVENKELLDCLCRCLEPPGGLFSCSYDTEDRGWSPSCRDLSNGPCICKASGCFRGPLPTEGECYDKCYAQVKPDTCGNGVCDKLELEDCETCPEDCACMSSRTQIFSCNKSHPEADDIGCYILVTCPQHSHVEHEKCVCDAGYTWNTDNTKCVKKTVCGDGKCEGSETYKNCPQDCPKPIVCGDGKCEGSETYKNCPQDCPKPIVCGDGKCEGSETYKNCPQDCPKPIVCGDGKCEGSENQNNCCTDCGCPEAKYCRNNRCEQAVAYILTSSSSAVGHGWYFGRIVYWPQKKLIARFFEKKGYRVVYRDVNGFGTLASYLAEDGVKAFAYFGHGATLNPSVRRITISVRDPGTGMEYPLEIDRTFYTPTMEEMTAQVIRDEVVRQITGSLTAQYQNQGMSPQDARRRAQQDANRRSSGGWLDYFYNNACYSFDDKSMTDTFVRPGGTYWGNQGTGHATIPLTEYVKPGGCP